MKLIWHNIIKERKYSKLILEGTVLPNMIYYFLSKKFEYNYLLIRSYDLKTKNFDPLVVQLKHANIQFNYIYNFIIIESTHILNVFDKTEFGQSLDSYFLLAAKPDNKTLVEIYNLNLNSDSFGDNDIFVSYEEIPDLQIFSKNEDLLYLILNNYLNN